MSWEAAKRRIRPLRISKRNGNPRVFRRKCTPDPHGKEASNRKNLSPPSHPHLPSHPRLLLHQDQLTNLPSLQRKQRHLPMAHRLQLPLWWHLREMSRVNPLSRVSVLKCGVREGRPPAYCASARTPYRPRYRWPSRRRIESRSPTVESSLSRSRPAYRAQERPA